MKRNKLFAILSILLALVMLAACRPKTDPAEEKIYSFLYKDVKIAVGDAVQPVLDALKGEEVRTSAVGSCLSSVEGEDVTYAFASIHIKTFRREEGDPEEVIRSVALLDDSLKTPEGIAIGSMVEAVKEAYGKPSVDGGTLLIYKGSSMRLKLGVRDGAVTNIEYEAVDATA